MSAHTPLKLPLAVNGSETTTAIWIEDSGGERILTIKNCYDDLDRAEFIVKAVNAHDDLVAACREIANGYSTRGSEMAREALAKAGAK